MKKQTKTIFTLWALLTIIYCNGNMLAQNSLEIEYGNNQKKGNHIISNGAEIYYEKYGKGSPLILLHGNHGSIAYMHNQISFFSEYFEVIAIDNRNHGKSSNIDTLINYEIMANDVITLMDSLNIPKAHVIGWSDGANIGLQIARLAPTRVRKLIMFAGNYKIDTTVVAPSIINDLKNGISKSKTKVEKSKFRLCLEYPKLQPTDLVKIKTNILISSSENDIIKPSHSKEMHSLLSNSRLFIFPDANHMLPIEKPSVFNIFAINYLKSNIDTVTIKGKVCDISNKGLEYVNIGIKGKKIGTTSLTNGEFELRLPFFELFNDSIFISSIGYEQKSLPIKRFIHDEHCTIPLNNVTYKIKEIKVKAQKTKYKTYGIKRAGNGLIKGVVKGIENAFLISTKGKEIKIEKINFGTNAKNKLIRYRINFYKPKDSVPGDRIYNKELLFENQSDANGWVNCNLSELDIFFDQDFYAAVELLPCLNENSELKRPHFIAKMIAPGSVYLRDYYEDWVKFPINSAINVSVITFK